jgi:predicted CopG family antitoxin
MSEMFMNSRDRNANSDRITITLDRKVYEHLKQYGKMGESFSTVIDKILREKEDTEVNSMNGGSW